MAKITAWLKKFWWIIVAVASAIVGVILCLVFTGGGNAKRGVKVKNYTKTARKRIDEVEAKYLLRKAEVKAEGTAQRRELCEIKQIEDPRQRRRKLASWLKGKL